MQIAYEILRILADGKFHSGTDLASRLKVSRTQIWKGIHFLRLQGSSISGVTSRGYLWSKPTELLDKDQIVQGLTLQARENIPFIALLNMVGSTNDYIMDRITKGVSQGFTCISEGQNAGKGRMGKHWVSPLGANIYLSLLWQFPKNQNYSALGLTIALAILDSLSKFAPLPAGLGVKWPNDIWFNNNKLGGILIESKGNNWVIGIGLNVSMPRNPTLLSTDLETVWRFLPSRNHLIANLLNSLVMFLKEYEQNGFVAFMPLWQKYDLLFNKPIQFSNGEQVQEGIALGVNESGELKIKTAESVKLLRHGDISIRPVPYPL